MSVRERVIVTVTGAAGQIGYALLFRLASGQVFGPSVDIELKLLEVTAALPALRGVVMELEDCAFERLCSVVVTDDANIAMKDANWVIMVGAVPRKAGMERGDLLEINGPVFKTQGRAINAHAHRHVKVLVVGNPCNSNCLITQQQAPDIPAENFYAMTMLDENRARAQLAVKASMPVTAVENMVIWGNHSATQYPDFYHARLGDRLVSDVIHDEAWLKTDFIRIIQQRGAEVIKARGASSAASAANAIVNTLQRVTQETPKGQAYSLCRVSKGEYDVDEGLVFSFPCRTDHQKVSVLSGWTHNPFSQEKIQATLAELRQERDQLRALKFIN